MRLFFDNVKMKVNSCTCEQVQKILFENGGSWSDFDKTKRVQNINAKYLFIENMKLFFSNGEEDFFDRDPNEEISAELYIKNKGRKKSINQKNRLIKIKKKLNY